MKKIFALAVLVGALGLFNVAWAQEKISSFDVGIHVNKDTTIEVTETIKYDFGTLERHGIYRDIPFKYEARGGNYNLRLTNVTVRDENGQAQPFKLSTEGKYKRIRIGQEDVLVSGEKTYVINYKVKRAINFFADHDELYWNATGDEWQVPIEKSSARVNFPAGTTEEGIKLTCYAGQRNTFLNCDGFDLEEKDGSAVAIWKQGELGTYNGLTIVAGWPKGIVQEPSRVEKIVEAAKDNWGVTLPFLTLGVMIYLWQTRGRDPEGRGTIVVQYDVPDKLTPAEVGTVMDESADNTDVSALIIQLAVKGYLKIKKEKENVRFGPDKDDYLLTQLKESDESLTKAEKLLLDGLFKGAKKVQLGEGLSQVKLSDLKNEFHETLSKITASVCEDLKNKGYFAGNPDDIRAVYIVFGIIAAVFGGIVGGVMENYFLLFGFIISGAIIFIFGFFMPQRTAKGVATKEYLLGLKKYLSVAEKDRLEFHNAPAKNPALFEKLLPYAMVFGVEDQWAKQFEGIYSQPPSWYADPSGASFNPSLFVSDINNFSDTADSTLASTPGSAAGGGSGFSGGGGGGFGGGGGGSW